MPEGRVIYLSQKNLIVLIKGKCVLHKVQGVHLSLGIRGKPNNLNLQKEELPEEGSYKEVK